MPANREARRENADMLRTLRNWFRNGALPEFAGGSPVKDWLRDEIKEAVLASARGQTISEGHVEMLVRNEINKEIRRLISNAGTLDELLRRLVREEIRRLLLEEVSIEMTVKGRVTKAANGSRAIDLSEGHGDE